YDFKIEFYDVDKSKKSNDGIPFPEETPKIIINTQHGIHVDISVTTPEAGVIDISLKGAIKTNFTTFISPSTAKGKRSKKILIREKKKGYAASQKALVFNSLPKGYDHSIYAFIKGIIPIGRVLKINNKDGANIITFNN
ncbi:DUF735 family protein, partial [Borreliella bavariensis]|uniref:DUF735 family protein n=1 Tax=Borreliella bavariensis TaxID=664662 RepID=UPI001F32D27E